ncbi:MAG: polyprenyl synthetase family protein [Planctomycetes bacterium]|nr:polyprenyl synthetase family protein [Planctomycetota bacterium]
MTSASIPLRDLTALVRPDLDRVAAELVEDLRPEQSDLLPFVEHAASYQGKQLRAALVFLAPRALGLETGDDHVEVAKIIELLHTATLVHDDVLDGAMIRRQESTINAEHGTELPVLLGDYIYARAFHMSVQLGDSTCSRVLADVTRRICQGEITQIIHRFDFDWTVERYDEVIRDKTALLYGAACRLGAHYSGAPAASCEALDRFGVELGMAFQIVDDCLDIDGDETVVGKSLGTDLGKGKLTLPLLWLMREPAKRDELRALMEGSSTDADKLERLHSGFDVRGAVDFAHAAAERRVRDAIDSVDGLLDGSAKDAMLGIADYVLTRRR